MDVKTVSLMVDPAHAVSAYYPYLIDTNSILSEDLNGFGLMPFKNKMK